MADGRGRAYAKACTIQHHDAVFPVSGAFSVGSKDGSGDTGHKPEP